MAISIQTANITSLNFGSATSYTLSATISSGSGTKLVVQISRETTNTPTSVKWNTSESLTAGKQQNGTTNSAEIWYLDAPTATTANVVATYALANFAGMGIIPIDGTLTGVGTTGGGSGSGAPSIAITTAADNSLNVDSLYQNNKALSISADGTNQTERWRNDNADGFRSLGSTQTTTAAGSYTMSYSGNIGAANTYVMAMVEIKSSTASAVVSVLPTLPLMGVG